MSTDNLNYLFKLQTPPPPQLNLPPTTPPSCNSGCPQNNYPATTSKLYSNANLLYSLYQSYQNTAEPTYLANNIITLCQPDYGSNLPYIGPSNIFIGRHGEKSTPTTAGKYYYTVNCNGVQRSAELPELINDLATSGYPIFAIITSNADMSLQESRYDPTMRQQQTAMMSAWLLNIPLYIFQSQNVSQPYDATTATTLFTNTIFQGKNILILWEHCNIQSLANQLVQCNEYINHNPDPSINQSQAISNLTSDPTGRTYLYNVKIDPTTHTYTETANVSTKNWWINNTIVNPDYEYAGIIDVSNAAVGYKTQTIDVIFPYGEGLKSTTFTGYTQGLLISDVAGQAGGQCAYTDPLPYVDYSQILPYWNDTNYDNIYWLYQAPVSESDTSYDLKMTYFVENVSSCYANCQLPQGIMGAIQYTNCQPETTGWTNYYLGDTSCNIPDGPEPSPPLTTT
jgi:hypothetical protein